MDRREMLQLLGLAAGSAAIGTRIVEASEAPPALIDYIKPPRPVTAIVIGAGGRGDAYMEYAVQAPDELNIVGIAEPLVFRNEHYAHVHGIPENNRFDSWEQVFEKPRFADVVIITTQDAMHYEPAMAALEAGYDLLLEKPIAPSWQECEDILTLAREKDAVVGVGHVLRYAPYFQYMKHVVSSGQIGEIVHLEHTEPVGFIHYSHSYVRGPWGITAESNPLLLSKSCHDLDIIRWIVDEPCKRVSSFGSRKVFRPEGAPKGAGKRCVDCPIESQCHFSALKIYLRGKHWGTRHFYMEETDDEAILQALKYGPPGPWDFGRCAYHTDADVLDSQFVGLQFDNDINVNFSLTGVSREEGRRTRIFGTEGTLVGDNHELLVHRYDEDKATAWSPETAGIKLVGRHYGGDRGLMRDFVQAVSRHDKSLLASSLEASMESHYIGFKAGESRSIGGGFVDTPLSVEFAEL